MRIILSLLSIFPIFCSFQNTNTAPISKKPKHPFTIVKATSQEWIGGREESGRGVNYIIRLKTRAASQQLVIDQLWIGDKYHPITLTNADSGNIASRFAKGDTLHINASKLERSPNANEENGSSLPQEAKNIPLPFKYKGEALLGYKLGDKRKYIVIKAFEPLPQLAYP